MCKLRLCFVQYSAKAAFAKGALIDFLVYLSLKKNDLFVCVCGWGGTVHSVLVEVSGQFLGVGFLLLLCACLRPEDTNTFTH